jgi:uncharacterized protein YukE
MSNELEALDKAIECIKEEQSSVLTEREAFQEFRKTVSLAQPANSGTTTNTTSMTELTDSYQESVMSTPDYRNTYADSLAESLTAELTPSIAHTLLSESKISQKQKRDLLLATTRAIKQRDQYRQVLNAERQSLRAIREELCDIEETLSELPPCSIEQLSFEEYVKVWREYDAQLERCNRLLQDRQGIVQEARQPALPRNEDSHTFNAYLFSELETTYPALQAIASTRQRIIHTRDNTKSDHQSSIT